MEQQDLLRKTQIVGHSLVLTLNIKEQILPSCPHIFSYKRTGENLLKYSNCDAEVSIYGLNGKATENGQLVGRFYNFGCDRGDKGGYEVSTIDKAQYHVVWPHLLQLLLLPKAVKLRSVLGVPLTRAIKLIIGRGG